MFLLDLTTGETEPATYFVGHCGLLLPPPPPPFLVLPRAPCTLYTESLRNFSSLQLGKYAPDFSPAAAELGYLSILLLLVHFISNGGLPISTSSDRPCMEYTAPPQNQITSSLSSDPDLSQRIAFTRHTSCLFFSSQDKFPATHP